MLGWRATYGNLRSSWAAIPQQRSEGSMGEGVMRHSGAYHIRRRVFAAERAGGEHGRRGRRRGPSARLRGQTDRGVIRHHPHVKVSGECTSARPGENITACHSKDLRTRKKRNRSARRPDRAPMYPPLCGIAVRLPSPMRGTTWRRGAGTEGWRRSSGRGSADLAGGFVWRGGRAGTKARRHAGTKGRTGRWRSRL